MAVAPEAQDGGESLVLSFQDIIPQRKTIIINGRELSAYVWNRRCPRSVRAQVFDAHRDAQDPVTRKIKSQLAQENCTTKTLMAMIPGLGYTEADALEPDEVADIEMDIGLRPDTRRGAEPSVVEPHPQKGGTTRTSTKPTGVKSSSGSRRRSA